MPDDVLTAEAKIAALRALCDSKGNPGGQPVRNRGLSVAEVRAILDPEGSPAAS